MPFMPTAMAPPPSFHLLRVPNLLLVLLLLLLLLPQGSRSSPPPPLEGATSASISASLKALDSAELLAVLTGAGFGGTTLGARAAGAAAASSARASPGTSGSSAAGSPATPVPKEVTTIHHKCSAVTLMTAGDGEGMTEVGGGPERMSLLEVRWRLRWLVGWVVVVIRGVNADENDRPFRGRSPCSSRHTFLSLPYPAIRALRR